MRISKVEVQQVFNTGNYENIRFSAEASVGEDEDAGAVTSELRAFVAAQHQVFIAEREAQRAAERAVFEAEQAQRRAAWEAEQAQRRAERQARERPVAGNSGDLDF